MNPELDNCKFKVKCKGGWLAAFEVGDGDMYCGIVIDFVRDDGKACQCAWVETVDEHDCVDGRDMLHVLVWDGEHEDYVLEQEIDRNGREVY